MTFGDGPADKSLRDAWSRFCDQLKDAGDSVFKDANPGAPMMRADAFRFLTQNLGQAFDLALETKDPAFPQIHPLCTPTRKLGGDVADFTYRQAWIDGNHTYRITGKRGTARWLNVTVQGPRPETDPGHRLAQPARALRRHPRDQIFGHQLRTDDDGRFELYVGGAERAANWLPTTPGSRKLFIREAFDAWCETPTTLSIERVGMDGPRPIPTSERDDRGDGLGRRLPHRRDARLARTFVALFRRCVRSGVHQPVPARPKSADTDADAKRGRMAAHMIWELKPDEALIVEMDNHDGFWIFGMGGVFVGSMDFLYRAGELHPRPHPCGRRQRGAARDRPRRPGRAQLA